VNYERKDERDAKGVVERALQISLDHFDTHGGVDYRSSDGSVALEVTRVTDGRKRAGRSALAKSESASDEPPLASCWLMFVPATHGSMKNLERRIREILPELEMAGIRDFDRGAVQLQILERRPKWQLLERIYRTGIESLWASPHPDDPEHVHELILSTTWDGSIGGSNESLQNLLEELDSKTDNVKKMTESRANTRVLFVWIDGDTPYEIQRPLAAEPPRGLESLFGPPALVPALDPAITHLWVVHEVSRLGWFWDGSEWMALEGV
jgi:hypothetical protein